jgi:phosphoribosylanthranilate isomerase
MIVQIYEVTTPAEACVLGAIGIDHIGVLIGEGSFPREQTIDKAREIFAAIPSGSKTSALALSHDVDLIVPLTAALVPDILHLGGAPQHLSPAQLWTLKAEFPQVSLSEVSPVTHPDLSRLRFAATPRSVNTVRWHKHLVRRHCANS